MWISIATSKPCKIDHFFNLAAYQADVRPLTSIENPLSHLTPEQLQRDVRAFARSNRLDEHLELLERAAQIAKDPQYFNSISGVTEIEKQALHDERQRSFRQPRALYLTILICSIGAAVQGWDQTGSNGAVRRTPNPSGP